MGPYIVDGHFMYGNTFCIPPYDYRPPYYHTICHHRAPGFRRVINPCRTIADDGIPYSEPDNSGATTNANGECSGIIRNSSVPNILNVTARKITALKIHLFGVTEDDDTIMTLEVGTKYAITYLTSGGYKVAVGYLKYIDESISDECTSFIGNYNDSAMQQYIGLDCSTSGNSSKVKIYLSSIRAIEELDPDEDYNDGSTEDGMTAEEALDKIIKFIDKGLVFCHDVHDKPHGHGPKVNTDDNDDEDSDDDSEEDENSSNNKHHKKKKNDTETSEDEDTDNDTTDEPSDDDEGDDPAQNPRKESITATNELLACDFDDIADFDMEIIG